MTPFIIPLPDDEPAILDDVEDGPKLCLKKAGRSNVRLNSWITSEDRETFAAIRSAVRWSGCATRYDPDGVPVVCRLECLVVVGPAGCG